ncbi:MAG TPA: GTP cyclohydrolase I FolE [Candidatus Dormibacteraeota bacterium]|jgi:GTP cyclohydrolase I|nr:GTP cyclohydrolase I FolE [Candidatus Dormibacteraeota bacterium]
MSAEREGLVGELLRSLGQDPDREGLRDTPRRVSKTLEFLTSGDGVDPVAVLRGALFLAEADAMVLVRDVEFYSLCEHHLVPFYGRAHIAYVPDRHIVGLSKLARVVDALARRLQVQERLTTQVAEAIQAAVEPKGVGVVLEARHLCMMMRGVQKQTSEAVTSCMLGRFRTDARTRGEFLQLISRKQEI